jgi:outer membrane protein assembly factor BamD (BamD/ComL family)
MIPFADRFPLFRVLAILVIACAATTGAVQAQQDEELPRRRLESGREYLRTKNYAEALKDFEAILQSYPSSSVADDALLEIATYQLDVARDPAAADASVKNLLKTYPAADAAAKALVLQGRVLLELGREPEDVNAAIASFERVARLFPGNEAVPASMFYAGLATRRSSVTPSSPFSIRRRHGRLGRSLVSHVR